MTLSGDPGHFRPQLVSLQPLLQRAGVERGEGFGVWREHHPHANRDHRQRLRRALGSHTSETAGRGGLPRLRARRGCWRHVTRQQLPGLRLRRAVAPLLLLLRAEPRLDAQLLPAARNLGVPAALRATSVCCRTYASTTKFLKQPGTTARNCGASRPRGGASPRPCL